MLAEPMTRPKIQLRTHDAAHDFFVSAFQNLQHEALRVAHLDAGYEVIGVRLQYSGHCDLVRFPIRQIVHDALELGSTGLILAHNHPSGDPAPSRADLLATRALVAAVRPLGICVYDHIIFAGLHSVSLRVTGML